MSSIKKGDPALTEQLTSTLADLPRGPVAVAFSGGSDSLALALLLSRAIGADGGRELLLFHVEHNLRGGERAVEERERVERLAATLGLPVYRKEIPPGAVNERSKGAGGVEAAARELRYFALGELVEETGAVALCTGHHRDDQLETVLLRFLRGGPVENLGGIPRVRSLGLPDGGSVPLLRPLLSVPREDLEATVAAAGLEAVEDESNRDQRYERNYLRHTVIPALRRSPGSAGFSEWDGGEGVLRSGARLREVGSDLRRRAGALRFRRIPGALSVEAREFFGAPGFVRAAALELRAGELGLPFPGRSRRFLHPLLKEPAEPRCFDRGESRLLLEESGHRFTLHRGRLLWQYDIVPYRDFRYLHVVETPALEIVWMRGVCPFTEGGGRRRGVVISIPEESLRPPVVVRSRRRGDRLFWHGRERPLKTVLDRLRIPQVVRENIPIIEDREGVLALPTEVFGFPALVRDGLMEAGGHAWQLRFFVHGDLV